MSLAAGSYDLFELGDHPLQNGGALGSAKLAYKTYGTLNDAGTNAVVFPTAYGGTHVDNEWLIASGMALDPARWFVICPNLFGAGLSSSPSNTPGAQGRGAFPHVTIYDNVAAQHRLVSEVFGIKRIALVTGFSMGAQQSFHWAAAHPEMVERIAPVCGSARTAEHNVVFLDGIEATLTTDPVWNAGFYDTPPVSGQRAVGRVWAGWGLSQTWYREERWRENGADSREAFVRTNYEGFFCAADANDLLAMLWTWRAANIALHPRYDGDFERALRSIDARAYVMPSRTDLYFPPEDSEIEVRHLRSAELHVIESVYGHAAGAGVAASENAFVDAQIARLLSE